MEGHGEYESVRTLIERVWIEHLGGEYVEVLRPIRRSRNDLAREDGVKRAVGLALSKLAITSPQDDPGVVLILLDADEDLPCKLAPQILEWAQRVHPKADIACVLANVEYETWFVAAAESLQEYLDLRQDEVIPANPERLRLGKAWIERHFRGVRYSETQDQPSMTARMDLSVCRRGAPSFDKLCREFERRLRA